MSYSRFSHADVDVYMDVNGSLACCGCLLTDDPETSGGWYYNSTDEMIAHLDKHRAAGHDVPDYLDDALREDDEENFPPACHAGHDWGEPFIAYPGPRQPMNRVLRKRCTRCDWVASAGMLKIEASE